MNYWELRKAISQIIPREKSLFTIKAPPRPVKEKGRKSGYQEYKLDQAQYVKQERLLNSQEINSFLEVSCRAAACPMPFNMDVWDGLLCPYNCRYCYANAFRASLYTAFFDNSKTMGLRHCNPDKYKKEMDALWKYRGQDPHKVKNPIAKCIAMEIPVRFGIRFEDFLDEEKEEGISLELLEYLGEHNYPLMINSKSAILGTKPYLKALSKNTAGAAVHTTLISSNNQLLKEIEPGAPSYEDRLAAMKRMVDAGIRVVARIEPFLPFVNDVPEEVEKYMEDVWGAGVRNITFDTYSYTAKNPGISQSFKNIGMDWNRIFLVGCDSQALGSLLLGKFMDLFRERGFSCSTFDMGNSAENDQDICCEVGDWFKGGFNYGCTVMAARFIQRRGRKGKSTTWGQFHKWVDKHGGFLSEALEKEVHQLWNCEGNDAYSHAWSRGLEAIGNKGGNIIWKFDNNRDFREDILKGVL